METAEEDHTRERWLNRAVDMLRPWFEEAGHTLPPVKVSCGWPAVGGTSTKRRRIGECWKQESAEDGHNHIFISPVQDQPLSEDGQGVLETLIHELCHAVDNCESGHGAGFRKVAVGVGLEGKMTSTVVGERLRGWLEGTVIPALGPYPHGRLNVLDRPRQTTRMVKLECEECGYVARTTRKWLETGAPLCPCNGWPMEPDRESLLRAGMGGGV